MQSINRLIKRIKRSKTSLRYQFKWSPFGGGSFGLQSKIGLQWHGMKNLIFNQNIHNPVQNGWDTHQRLAIICAFSLVFNEIALPLLIPPSPFSMLSMLDCPIDFVAATTLKWGGGVKENKDVRDWKILFNKHSVSTLFARDCRLKIGQKECNLNVCLLTGPKVYSHLVYTVLTAVEFIREVCTVLFTITNPLLVNTLLSINTSEVMRSTCVVPCMAIFISLFGMSCWSLFQVSLTCFLTLQFLIQNNSMYCNEVS